MVNLIVLAGSRLDCNLTGQSFLARNRPVMIHPQRALVRPRVLSPISGEAMLLEDEISSLLDRGVSGAVAICGAAGTGKTTALEHLAAVFPRSAPITFQDEPDINNPTKIAGDGLVIFTSPQRIGQSVQLVRQLVAYRIVPWGDDELIEYLLAAHKDQCSSVMARLKTSASSGLMMGNPELCRIVLDEMSADAAITDARQAMRQFLATRLPAGSQRELAQTFSVWSLQGANEVASTFMAQMRSGGFGQSAIRAICHEPMQTILAIELILTHLEGATDTDILTRRFPRTLVREVGLEIRAKPKAMKALKQIIKGGYSKWQATAASMLHASHTGWKPEGTNAPPFKVKLFRRGELPVLSGAYLEHAEWPGVNLAGAFLNEADLSHSNLSGANLDQVVARRANLSGARLHRASMRKIDAHSAQFVSADLTAVLAQEGKFENADLAGANFDGAFLESASFERAILAGARFAGANMSLTNLIDAKIDGADFSKADLKEACLTLLNLQLANFAGARFVGADLTKCNLEDVELPGVDFERANLNGAVLTGSSMPGANFHGALLVNTGLAEIDWEGANLGNADLRMATFHMGTSRSGLVASPYASEGTRTGFYTDEFGEQEFKAPEEIRKANLRGADLRGAKIGGVDFYLVDLRDAQYDNDQAAHFRRCRAILSDQA